MWRGLYLSLMALLALGGCADSAAEADEPAIVATTTIVGDLASRVAGDEAVVEVLIPIGADPCSYEPAPEQTRSLLEADLIVSSGLGLEVGLGDVLRDAEHRGVWVLRLGEELYPRHVGNSTDEALDPYWWMDPLRAAGAVTLIADRMHTIRDGHWVDRAWKVDQSLCALDDEIRDLLRRCEPGPRRLITSQVGLGYFAERYDCVVAGPDVAPLGPMGPASETRVPALSDGSLTGGVSQVPSAEPVHWGVSLLDPSTPGGVSAEKVAVFIDSLGGPGSGAETYEDMMLTNADRIAHAGSTVLVQRRHTDA